MQLRSKASYFCTSVGGFILLLFASYSFLFNLSETSIDQGSDEVIYARVTQTLVHSWERGEVGIPLKHGTLPFFEKPPLKLILSALSVKLFGNTNFGLRILDGLLGLLSVSLSVLLIWSITNSLLLGLVTGYLLVLVPEWVLFAHSFRRNVLDGFIVALTLIASFWSWKGYQDLVRGNPPYAPFAIFSAICGVATLAKSVAGLVPIFSLLILILLHRSTFKEKLKCLLACSTGPIIFCGYCVFLLICAPKALNTLIGTEIVHRATSGFDGHNVGQPLFYLKYLLQRGAFLPASLMAVGMLGVYRIFTVKNSLSESVVEDDFEATKIGTTFLFAMAFCPVLLFSLSSAKLPWYISPYAPFFIGCSVVGIRSCVQWLTNIFLVNQKSAYKYGVQTILIILLCLPIIPRVERVVRFVLDQNKRIPIDLVVERILATDGGVIIVDNVISSRATPIKGRFNVEGIYKEMLQGRVRHEPTVSNIQILKGDFVFIPEELKHTLPEGGTEIGVLPPLTPRRTPVVIVRY